MREILTNTGATEVITGHNNKGPCKHWGYIRFANEQKREDASSFIMQLVMRKVIKPKIYLCNRGPLNECWRCGAIDEEKAQGELLIKVQIYPALFIQPKRTVKCPTRPLKQVDIKALKYQIDSI